MSKTAKTTKIAISLPEEVLDAVERERGESGESRSEFFRRAVEALLRRQREQELSEQYVHAYQVLPESPEEVEAARRAASNILAEEPWQ
jgi:metal-responsive CopG/Arc/MetJ family transcriptional regulator